MPQSEKRPDLCRVSRWTAPTSWEPASRWALRGRQGRVISSCRRKVVCPSASPSASQAVTVYGRADESARRHSSMQAAALCSQSA